VFIKANISKIVLSVLIISVTISAFFPTASAKTFTEAENIRIFAGEDYSLNITSAEGMINYTWSIVEDKIKNISIENKLTFNITFGDTTRVGVKAGEFTGSENVVTPGNYTFIWTNDKVNETINLTYIITYPIEKKSIDEEEDGIGSGCYSSILMVVPIIFFVGYGTLRKR
jgi:hypothetical protein